MFGHGCYSAVSETILSGLEEGCGLERVAYFLASTIRKLQQTPQGSNLAMSALCQRRGCGAVGMHFQQPESGPLVLVAIIL